MPYIPHARPVAPASICRPTFATVVLAALFCVVTSAHADPPAKPADAPAVTNLFSRTLGGTQFWTDEFLYDGWRIQRNVLSGHCRLLDDHDVRQAWGSYAECRTRFDALCTELSLPRMKPRAVLLLHGLGRSRDSMAGMAKYLAEHGDYTVLTMSYASTRESLADHARSLSHVVENLQDVEQLNFVGHSLGNLVVRYYLADRQRAGSEAPRAPRFGRMVMLGPPNQGSALAERFAGNALFGIVLGASGEQLGANWTALQKQLAVPRMEFGIIAGGRGAEHGDNPLIAGDDDLVVRVEETRLVGAADFVVVPAVHTLMMDHPTVQEYTLRFLQRGWFVAKNKRQPIRELDEKKEAP